MRGQSRKGVDRVGRSFILDGRNRPCVWMNFGVIEPTACLKGYDCLNCPLDKKLKSEMAEGKLKGGRVRAEGPVPAGKFHRPVSRAMCRHTLSGLTSYKTCANRFDCAGCSYHRMLMDEEEFGPPVFSGETLGPVYGHPFGPDRNTVEVRPGGVL
ncbi:MAG: hypothetical protein AB1896_15725 [Thermodesulfobacteriota bacterium]